MRLSRTFILATVSLLMFCLPVHAQRLDVKGIRKKSKAVDCATVVFKSDFDCLSIIGMSPDTIYRKKGCDYSHVWTQYVDLRYEREHSTDSVINRIFRLHTPYTEDVMLIVPGKGRGLNQNIYEYKVRVIDYFPFRIACEADIVRMRDYFGFRVSAGKKVGGYVSLKLGFHEKEGFNADDVDNDVDLSKKSYIGRIRNSYLAGIKYGVVSRDYPVYVYCGVGYGDDGSQRSNGKKKGKGRVAYYNNYTSGLETEIGANIVLFDFLSISMGADAIFGHRIAFDLNCTLGFVIDLTQ